jgi:hypothetical protein
MSKSAREEARFGMKLLLRMLRLRFSRIKFSLVWNYAHLK